MLIKYQFQWKYHSSQMSSDGTFKSNDQIMSQVKLKFIDTKSSHTTDFKTVFLLLTNRVVVFFLY